MTRQRALVAAAAAIDAVTAGILLFGTPHLTPLEAGALALAHGVALSLLWCITPARASRRWLCSAALLAVPLAGAGVAAVLSSVKGRGALPVARRERTRRGPPRITASVAERLGRSLSFCDALDDQDGEQRRATLWALSRRGDPEAIALLRRATFGTDPDLALSAALVLDEISERLERETTSMQPAEARRGAG